MVQKSGRPQPERIEFLEKNGVAKEKKEMVNTKREYISIAILFIVNLLNYVDRYTVAGVLTQVQSYYKIDDSMAGLIQTVFLAFFMIGSPICGYLGDRMNRKWIIIGGVIIWLAAVFASTFVPSDYFWLFLLCRGVVGIGEASYSNVSPSLISDMFTGSIRSKMYMLFYFAVPVGSGLGFVIGSNVASATGHWQWGVRVTAFAGLVALLFLIAFVQEPERGAAEKADGAVEEKSSGGSYWADLKALAKIPTFVACTWGYTALVFVTGTLTWWMPSVVEHSMAWNEGLNDTHQLPKEKHEQVGLIFGLITTVAGLIGVTAGTVISGWWRSGFLCFSRIKTARAQPLVSGIGALIASPLLLLVFIFGHQSIILTWVLMFIGITCLCLNWGLNVDMLMSVIVPSRRSTAFSYFMLCSHLFGDATGPYIIGAVSDAIRGDSKTPEAQYRSLVKACAVTVVLLVISALLYFLTAAMLVKDQKKYNDVMDEKTQTSGDEQETKEEKGISNAAYVKQMPSSSLDEEEEPRKEKTMIVEGL